MGSVSEASFMPSEGRSQQWRHHLCQVREVSTGEIKWVFQRHHLCQVRRSLHSPLFSRRTPGGLHQTQPIQNAEFLALEVLQFSSDFPVHACRTGESDGLSGRTVRRNVTKPAVKVHQKQPDKSRKSDGSPADSNGHQADRFPY